MEITQITRINSWDYECPKCKAKPGESCRSPSGRRYEQYHSERFGLAAQNVLKQEGKTHGSDSQDG